MSIILDKCQVFGHILWMNIRPFQMEDEPSVITLWRECGLIRAPNDPHRDILRKLSIGRDLFLVGSLDGRIVASVMAGYEGHRGWLNYVAVAKEHRGRGFGKRMVTEAERLLGEKGCPKINLLVLASNQSVIGFYRRMGYSVNDVICMGKHLA